MTPAEFESSLIGDGFGPAAAGNWEAGRVNPEHVHPFEVRGLVTDGEMTLIVDGQTQSCSAGMVFVMPKGHPHQEKVGPEGVSYIYAKR